MKYDSADHIGFTIVQCPICGSPVGRHCTRKKDGSPRKAHKPRRYKADGFVMGNNHRVRSHVLEMYTEEKLAGMDR